MIKAQILVFFLRWIISSAGMWLCINQFAHVTGDPSNIWLYLVAGLIFSLVNSVIKPLLTIMALPLIIVSLGIVTLLINVAMVALTIWVLPGVEMGFGGAVLSSLVMSLINYLVNFLVPAYNKN